VDCWLSLLNGGYSAPDLSRLSLHPPQPLVNPNHKILQAQVSDSTMGYGPLYPAWLSVSVMAELVCEEILASSLELKLLCLQPACFCSI
jgi:hypothetical protein